MSTFSRLLGVVLLLVLLLKLWNYFSRKYNYKILNNSDCLKCGESLGSDSLNNAVCELEKEKEVLKREGKIGDFKLHNMKLICPSCGEENFERDLYKANRENRN